MKWTIDDLRGRIAKHKLERADLERQQTKLQSQLAQVERHMAEYDTNITRLRFQLLSVEHGVEMYVGAEVVWRVNGEDYTMKITHVTGDLIGIEGDGPYVFERREWPAARVADARKQWLAQRGEESDNA